jgi:hypothetical protein
MQATQLWQHWQDLLDPCAEAFTLPGFQRFTEWLTGLVGDHFRLAGCS